VKVPTDMPEKATAVILVRSSGGAQCDNNSNMDGKTTP